MIELKNKLHELIDSTNDTIFLENIYNALKHNADLNKRDTLDDRSSEHSSEPNEAKASYQRGGNQ
ncbi:hypothetical protein BH11BAC2_BH11BAC2_18690 [soil metagenome]